MKGQIVNPAAPPGAARPPRWGQAAFVVSVLRAASSLSSLKAASSGVQPQLLAAIRITFAVASGSPLISIFSSSAMVVR